MTPGVASGSPRPVSDSRAPDPLDLSVLRAHRGRQRDHSAILDRIAAHLDEHDGFVAWSGGKDSTVVVDLARRVDPNVPVVFYNTGLEFPENLRYILDLTRLWSLNLTAIKTQPDLLTALVAAGGFAHGSPRHLTFSLRERLLLQPAATAHDTFGPGSLWGVRSAESSRRAMLYRTSLRQQLDRSCGPNCCTSSSEQRARHGGIVTRTDGTVTFGPIWNWTTDQVWEYLAAQNIPPNPIYAKLYHLGADADSARVDSILDAEHVTRGQISRLKHGWPQLYARLCRALPRLDEFA